MYFIMFSIELNLYRSGSNLIQFVTFIWYLRLSRCIWLLRLASGSRLPNIPLNIRQFFPDETHWNVYKTSKSNGIFTRFKPGSQSQLSYSSSTTNIFESSFIFQNIILLKRKFLLKIHRIFKKMNYIFNKISFKKNVLECNPSGILIIHMQKWKSKITCYYHFAIDVIEFSFSSFIWR